MFYSQIFNISTKGFCDIINITSQVEKIIVNSKIENGLVTVFISGSTAGVTTIEFEDGLIKDMQEMMEKLVPQNKNYHHNLRWQDGNGFSHLRASLIGASVNVPLIENELKLGHWQQIVIMDFDNKTRQREVIVQIIGDVSG